MSTLGRWRTFRLPLVWCVASLLIVVLSFAPAANPRPLEFESNLDTYYVNTPVYFGLALSVPFVAFAVIYLALRRLLQTRIGVGLAWTHLTLSVIGVSLIYSPIVALETFHISAPSRVIVFKILNAVSSAGYLVFASGLIVFLAVLAETVRSRRSNRVISG